MIFIILTFILRKKYNSMICLSEKIQMDLISSLTNQQLYSIKNQKDTNHMTFGMGSGIKVYDSSVLNRSYDKLIDHIVNEIDDFLTYQGIKYIHNLKVKNIAKSHDYMVTFDVMEYEKTQQYCKK